MQFLLANSVDMMKNRAAQPRSRSALLPALLIFLLSLDNTAHGQSQCNICSAVTNLACVSRTQFQICDDRALPIGPLNSCPTGYVCSSGDAQICQPDTGNVQIACSGCNICDSTLHFACTGPRTYALCLGNPAPSEITGSCDEFHVCSTDTSFICGNTTQGVAATCSFYDDVPNAGLTTMAPTTTTIVPTTPSTIDPVAFCQAIRETGRFPVGNDLATTCRQYINCFMNNGIWSGGRYNCAGSTFYHENTRLCGAAIPNRCVNTVQTLRFHNMILN